MKKSEDPAGLLRGGGPILNPRAAQTVSDNVKNRLTISIPFKCDSVAAKPVNVSRQRQRSSEHGRSPPHKPPRPAIPPIEGYRDD
jgi:hypothetical protein